MYFHFHPVLFLNFVSGTFVIASNDVEPDAFEFDFSRNTGNNHLVYNIIIDFYLLLKLLH